MVYIKSFKGQNWLLPLNIQDMIPADHICFLVEESIDNMDFSDFDEKVEGAGHPAYHPRILLKVLVQGMLDKVRSSRKLERACKENVVYLFLSERLNPNFRTISDFRKVNPELVDSIFKETVRLAQSMNLVSVEMICTDGSKIKANASRKLAIKREEFDLLDEWVKNEIEEGIKQDDIEDKLEEALDLKNKPKLARKDMKKIVREYRERLNDSKKTEDLKKKHLAIRARLDQDKDLKTVSLTDPDCRYMRSKKGPIELSYNVQTSVDSKHNIIVANNVCQEATDTRQGKPQLEKAETNLGQLPEGLKVCNDADYDDPPYLKWLEDRKFDAYIPLAEKGAKKKEGNEAYSKKFFKYNEAADTFTCSEGNTLPYKFSYADKKGHLLRNYHNGKACWSCPVRKNCCGTNEKRIISANAYEAIIRRMKAKMELDTSKQVYSKRKETVELAYAHIKHNLGFTEFLTRGLKGVKTEWNLVCAASNLRRIFTQLPKNWRQILDRTVNSFAKLFCPA